MTDIFKHMLEAKQVCQYSNCHRRKIGVVLVAGSDTIWGYNNTTLTCITCKRETCGAIHAEQSAILQAIYIREAQNITDLFIWAEPPCLQCLNFIKRYSAINRIYCLSPESYLTEYPIIARRSEEILERRAYARSLGISIIELDREEILEHELPEHSETDI